MYGDISAKVAQVSSRLRAVCELRLSRQLGQLGSEVTKFLLSANPLSLVPHSLHLRAVCELRLGRQLHGSRLRSEVTKFLLSANPLSLVPHSLRPQHAVEGAVNYRSCAVRKRPITSHGSFSVWCPKATHRPWLRLLSAVSSWKTSLATRQAPSLRFSLHLPSWGRGI